MRKRRNHRCNEAIGDEATRKYRKQKTERIDEGTKRGREDVWATKQQVYQATPPSASGGVFPLDEPWRTDYADVVGGWYNTSRSRMTGGVLSCFD